VSKDTREFPNGFHWRDGWMFSRMPDGSVQLVHSFKGVNLIIPAAEWASIVCSVSDGGESNGRHRKALEFHGL
jgi:hypothetical protein